MKISEVKFTLCLVNCRKTWKANKNQKKEGESQMISSGYFGVTKEKLSTMSLPVAKQFLWEMLTCGGRISMGEFHYWINWLLDREGVLAK